MGFLFEFTVVFMMALVFQSYMFGVAEYTNALIVALIVATVDEIVDHWKREKYV